MQRNQHDTQRRNDYSALSTAITNYMTNNNGRFPAKCETTEDAGQISAGDGVCGNTLRYINSQDNDGNGLSDDPSGNNYLLTIQYATDASWTAPEISQTDTNHNSKVYVIRRADCSGVDAATGEAQPVKVSGTRNFVIYGQLENGTYCAASS